MRIGSGFDLHRFKDGRKLILGGVEIAHERGLDGVSDADVLLHSLSDAILGALGKGDIGDIYPPDDQASTGLNSRNILTDVLSIMRNEKYEIENIDVTLITEEPRMKRHKPAIVENLSHILSLSSDRIGMKIKSQEALIPGDKAFAVCLATVLLQRDT